RATARAASGRRRAGMSTRHRSVHFGIARDARFPQSSLGCAMSIADLRREYSHARLDEGDVSHDPIVEFARWFAEAQEAQATDANAMTLATATAEGSPSARIVLLKAFDQRGFVFFTDYRSRKGAELEANPRAVLVFYWAELERQVRITGGVGLTTRE